MAKVQVYDAVKNTISIAHGEEEINDIDRIKGTYEQSWATISFRFDF